MEEQSWPDGGSKETVVKEAQALDHLTMSMC